jgi:hypothetical protein
VSSDLFVAHNISDPCIPQSHASIDPATRAAHGLPEDLICLCVGIEDPSDLLDDLERALLEAGAITLSADCHYVRLPQAISRAAEKLAFNESVVSRGQEDREWFVSAPGKVILFGEHAVVHGVVSSCFRHGMQVLISCTGCTGCICGSPQLWTGKSPT